MALTLGPVQLAVLCVAVADAFPIDLARSAASPSSSPSPSLDASSSTSSSTSSSSISSSPASAPSPADGRIQYYDLPDEIDGPSPAGGSEAAAAGPDDFKDSESSDDHLV